MDWRIARDREATAKAFASRGASVVLVARREGKLEDLAIGVESDDGDALVVPTDITEDDNVDNVVETTTDVHSRIDILVNNAGVMPLIHIADAGRETLDGTNVVSAGEPNKHLGEN